MTDNLTSSLTEDQRRLLELRLRHADRSQPVSFTQEQLWFLDRLDPGNPAYAIPFGLRLTGPLDRAALELAVGRVVDRHSALRTTFFDRDGELRQRVHDTVPIAIEVTDLSADRGRAGEVVREHARHVFDLGTGPLVAFRLVVLGEEEHLLLVTAHHIVFDAASAEVFCADLAACYGGATLPEPAASFARYAAAERRRLTGEVMDGHLAHWREKLAGSPARSTVPPDLPRPAVQTHTGGRRHFVVPAGLTSKLAARARELGVSLNAVVLSGFAAVIGQERVLLGMPVSGRGRPELESMIGSLANMLVLRVDLPDAPASEVIRATHRAISEAYAHQDAPYARVVEAVDPPRDPSRNPLFQAMLSLTEAPLSRTAGGVELTPVEVDNGLTDFDLFVVLSRVDGELRGVLGYNADLYLDETVRELGEQFTAVLTAIADEPERSLRSRQRISVAATFTADPVREPLDVLHGVLRLPVDVEMAPYQQIAQHLIGGDGGRPADVVLLRWEDWLRHGDALDASWEDFEAAVTAYRERSSAPLYLVVCPSVRAFGHLDDRLAVLADRTEGVRAVWFADWAKALPVGVVFDPQADKLGHVPYTPEMFAALAILLTRTLHAGAHRIHLLDTGLGDPAALAERAAPAVRAVAVDTPPVAPRTTTEERLARVWREVLKLDEVGVTHDFFALGGHSLLATQLLSKVYAEFGVDVSLHALFTHPTVEALAGLVEEPGETGHPLSPVPRSGALELSAIQQRMWAATQLDPTTTRMNTTFAVLLRGSLDVAAMRAAVAEVVGRHEILRTTFAERDGRPVMVVHAGMDCWLPEAEGGPEEFLREHTNHVYDLENGPLLRVRLVRTGVDEHHLLLGMHHIVCDNTSWGVLLAELSACYAHRELPELEVQYADYAAWQRELLTEEALEPHLDHWRSSLADAPSQLELPAERPERNDTERTSSAVPGAVAETVRELARAEGSTPFATLLAAYAVVLYRRSAQPDVVLSVPQQGRPRPEVEHLIGCFTDLLPIRVDLGGRLTFRQVLHRVHRAMVDGYRHSDVPFSSVAHVLPRQRGRHPVYQCAFNYADLPDEAMSWPGLDLEPLEVPVTSLDFDLFLTLTTERGELAATLEYSADLFTGEGAAGLLESFVAQLGELVSAPDAQIVVERPVSTAETLPMSVISSRPVDGVLPVLSSWADELGLPLTVRTTPAGQVLRPLLDPEAGLDGVPGETTALVLWWEDLFEGGVGAFEIAFARLCAAIERWTGRTGGSLAVLAVSGREDTPWPGVFGHAADRLARRFPAVSVVDLLTAEGDPGVVLGTALARLVHGGDLPEEPRTAEAPRTDEERALAAVWCEVLKLREVGVHDDFFELGGDSMTAIQVVWLANQAGIRFTPAQLTAKRTIAELLRVPMTEEQQALAAVWCEVLKLPEVGVHDDFFELGGDSMTAIQVVWLANQAGIRFTPAQLTAQRTIAELCAATAPRPGAEQGPVEGDFPATGAQRWFFEALATSMTAPAHFNHPYYLRLRVPATPEQLERATAALVAHHDGLRLRFRREGTDWHASHGPVESAMPFVSFDVSDAADRERAIERHLNEVHPTLDLVDGPLAMVVHFGLGDHEPDRVMVICHHLVTDGVSRSLILEDFQSALRQVLAGQTADLGPKTTAFRDWALRVDEYARGPRPLRELEYWERQAPGAEEITADLPGRNTFGVMADIHTTIDAETTARLRALAKAHRVGVSDLLVWASVRMAADRSGSPEWTIATTGHGREALFDGLDLSRTVGWFQVMYPVRLTLPGGGDVAAVRSVAEQLGRVPVNGIGYGLLRYNNPDPAVRRRLETANPQLTVNYAGAFGFTDLSSADELFDLCREELGVLQDPATAWPGRIDVVGSLVGDRIRVEMNYGTEMYLPETARRMLGDIEELLRRLVSQNRMG
ncbi:non-ribosomal peptide synthase domain TIGR01720 [Lentzea xinjiangensis]|uniref:Non-ribosomal peptide synthase domain TIGR01720 n=1 Tax=Lentzea xinjiangensis TaxID=402600 RepID=A0A1H9IZ77_9PSEU|nr:condensation domain-containing protein [Lentzea xinjiangensis]SEQ79836.1 non-ribosomal peptide synthase domain TIGR01720 [Lentzea xinjiangensis]